jgi:hypothetical protein
MDELPPSLFLGVLLGFSSWFYMEMSRYSVLGRFFIKLKRPPLTTTQQDYLVWAAFLLKGKSNSLFNYLITCTA